MRNAGHDHRSLPRARGGKRFATGGVLMAPHLNARTAQPVNQWKQLATVARERATEQSDKAATASGAMAAGPHLEQQAYLVRLAEVYEERARGVTEP